MYQPGFAVCISLAATKAHPMFGLILLRRMPPALTACLFYYGLPVFLVLRFLIGTVWGVFLLSALLYWMLWLVGDSKPLTPGQLLLWIDGLPTESKTAVITSLLTVLGFLVAFHTATLNWKAEALAQLKAHVAGEIELFFTEASRLTIDAKIYVHSLIEAVNSVQAEGPTFDAMFKIQRTLEQLPKFLATRDRLSAMSVEVHSIAGRHYSLLSTVWGATKVLEDSAAAFSEITKKMWVPLPNILDGHPDPVAEYLRQINVSECSAFVACCEQNYGFINGATGGLRGSLLAPLVGVNFSSVLSLSGKRSTFVEALARVREVKTRVS
jgi:hypothetical protein